jgi:hypothetical protein
MIDLKFLALMDFVAWLRGQYPRKIESGGAEEFVPYEDARQGNAEKADTSDAYTSASTSVDEAGMSARRDEPK